MNVELKGPISHFRFILVQNFLLCVRYNGFSFVFFPFIRLLCQYNGFVVIMNSNHVFDIKARPMEQLKFIETNTSEREKKQALKQRAGYILISTHKNTPKALRLNLPVHFHCYPHFPTYFSFFIHWLVLLSTAGKKNARENSKRKKWKKTHTEQKPQ